MAEKNRYRDAELQEFKELILQKVDKAKEYNLQVFSRDDLIRIFQSDQKNKLKPNRREGARLEFKESFNISRKSKK